MSTQRERGRRDGSHRNILDPLITFDCLRHYKKKEENILTTAEEI